MIYSRTLAIAVLAWSNLTETNISQRDMTASAETARRHALELQKRDLAAVQVLESKLNILHRWERGSSEWQAAAEKVLMRTYQHSIDILEGLVVARMFELTKMNRSQTGVMYFLQVNNN
jgi:DNA-binding transcriptional regulator YiaG